MPKKVWLFRTNAVGRRWAGGFAYSSDSKRHIIEVFFFSEESHD